MMITRRSPTHTLVIEVPLYLKDIPDDYSPVRDALDTALSISRAAYHGKICDDVTASLRKESDD